jgi:hypothetical protein
MSGLIADPRFKDFMDLVRSLKDAAVELSATHETVSNERTTLAAIGSVRAYLDIIGVYDSALAAAEEQIAHAAEEAETRQGERQSGSE